MRLLFILFSSVFTISCFSQISETQKPAVNSTSVNSPSTNSVTQEVISEKESDTISEVKDKSVSKSLDQNTYKSSVKKSVSKSEDIELSPSIEKNTTSTESMSYGFSLSKIQSSTQRNQRSPSEEQQEQMNETVLYFEKNAPESFEYHYYKYVSGNYSTSLVSHLLKAYQLKPNNTDVHIQLVSYYLTKGDSNNTAIYLKKIKDIDRITSDILNYAKDLLLSVPENGTLITHGFDDTYSCAYLQSIEKVRTDVQLISLDFLQSIEYQNNLKLKGYDLPDNSVINVSYLTSLCEKNEKKNLSISLMTPKEYFQDIQKQLFIVGLVFEFHKEPFNNFYKNDYLWNEVLEKKLVYFSLNEKSKQISSNYLPMLLQLRSFYQQQANIEKVKEIDEALDKVSVQCKKYDQVQKIKKSY